MGFFRGYKKTNFLLNEPDQNERTCMQNRPPFLQTTGSSIRDKRKGGN